MTCQVDLFCSKCGIVYDGRGAVVFRFRTALLPPFSVQLTRKIPEKSYSFKILSKLIELTAKTLALIRQSRRPTKQGKCRRFSVKRFSSENMIGFDKRIYKLGKIIVAEIELW